LLELREAAEGKDRRETQMILNHKSAIEFLLESMVFWRCMNSTRLNFWLKCLLGLMNDLALGTQLPEKLLETRIRFVFAIEH